MRMKLFTALSAVAALSSLAPAASALDSNVNQIAGTISFSNTLLALPAFGSGSVSAYSLTPQAGLSGSVGTTASASGLAYKVSVNASDFTHQISASAYVGSNAYYYFEPKISAPVPNEPAADVQLNLRECVGLVHVRYLDAQTLTPVSVANPSVAAYYNGGHQASGWNSQATQLDFPVRGDGSLIHFNVSYSTGSDAYTDLIYTSRGYDQVVGCDEEINVDVLIPSGGNGTGSGQLGEIIGYFNLLGESETMGQTLVAADDGPFGNYRYSSVAGNPAEGPYDLRNLLPSDTVSPSKPWRVWGQTSFNNALGVSQYFRSEGVYTPVTAGPPTSLGNTFVMKNQTISGGIVIEGLDACSQKLQPTSSATNMYGASIYGLAEARAAIKGSFFTTPAGTQAFAGNHLLAFGTPNNGNSPWNAWLNTYFQNPTNPNAAISIQYNNRAVGAIPSGNLPIQQCVGEFRMPLNVNTVGVETTFHAPSAVITGGFKGTDFASAPADYSIYATASGLPDASSPPVNSTVMPLCLPVGDYVVKPSVVAVSGAGEANTQLAEVANLTVGCGAIINTDVVTVEEISCGSTSSHPFKMTARDVYSKVGVSLAIAHVTSGTGAKFDVPICGGSASHACASGTAIADTFDIRPPQLALLAPCQNSVVVEVIDSVGNSSQSGVVQFTHENVVPVCNDVTVTAPANASGALVNYATALNDMTACGHTPTMIYPNPASKYVNKGVYKQQIKYKTECSAAPANCTVNVTVK